MIGNINLSIAVIIMWSMLGTVGAVYLWSADLDRQRRAWRLLVLLSRTWRRPR